MQELAEILLGTKEIAFSLHTHDPRTMQCFSKRWRENQNKPGWHYDETQQHEELFQHRLGKRPDLKVLLASIPILPSDKIPKDGKETRRTRFQDGKREHCSGDETQAVILTIQKT